MTDENKLLIAMIAFCVVVVVVLTVLSNGGG